MIFFHPRPDIKAERRRGQSPAQEGAQGARRHGAEAAQAGQQEQGQNRRSGK